ncbi:diacylglycerol/lipid kinase family protein [Leifsonia sp. A12D58]|uniref:diacylglycerol/lipid kinase family protein n=1 Tax=Leifsonia sp. A12D58 TaxID=3397674 RepID=UPI0039E16C6E
MPASGKSKSSQYAAVVYNPIKVDLQKLRASVTAAQIRARWGDTLWFATTEKDAGQHVTRLAVRQGASVVIAAGGDGTVRAVAEALRDTEVGLAVVPAGTGNLLARNLQLPLSNLDDSVALAFSGVDREIDLGVATVTTEAGDTNDHVFLVMAGVGVDAQMLAATRTDLKKQVGWLAYVDAGVRVLPKSKPFRIRYSLDGRPDRSTHISTILIANCGLLPGNLQLLPEAQLDDGILDIAILRPKGVLGWLKLWRKVSWENGFLRRSEVGRSIIRLTETSDERDMLTLRGGSIRLVPDEPREFELDGDEFGLVKSVYLRADRRALIVRVPAPPAA